VAKNDFNDRAAKAEWAYDNLRDPDRFWEWFRARNEERRYHRALQTPPDRTLAQIRESVNVSQLAVALHLDVSQATVSRQERRSDALVSSLDRYIVALGGRLELIVRFPGHSARLVLRQPDVTSPSAHRSR
jgi:hypothetical protein